MRNELSPAGRDETLEWMRQGEGGAYPPGTNLCFIIDAAQSDAIYPMLRRLAADEEIIPLYDGAAAMEMARVAPYILGIGTGRVFDWLWRNGWGRNWGVFAWSVAEASELREHFRRLTRVKVGTRQSLLFRFYDPRVLAALMPTFTPEQAGLVFGPIACYFTEAEAGRLLHRYSRKDSMVHVISMPVKAPGPPETV